MIVNLENDLNVGQNRVSITEESRIVGVETMQQKHGKGKEDER